MSTFLFLLVCLLITLYWPTFFYLLDSKPSLARLFEVLIVLSITLFTILGLLLSYL